MKLVLGDYIHDCTRLGMKPFILSVIAGVWFVVLNILNACTQPPAEVVLHTPSSNRPSYIQPKSVESIPEVQSAPVETVAQTELPPLKEASVTITPAPILQAIPSPVARPQPDIAQEVAQPRDPSLAELIETGERLTLGDSVAETPIATVSPVPVMKQLTSSTFVWPVHGNVISKFGSKPGGIRNDGINIAAEEDTPVQAVADGKVLYMNNAMKGYGNLILIRHANGWISTYAHNKSINVAQGATVHQGDVIAYVGKTGNVTSPQLHFSLRKEKKPVNPEQYLATNFAQKR